MEKLPSSPSSSSVALLLSAFALLTVLFSGLAFSNSHNVAHAAGDTLTLNLSEDAYNGDAKFVVAIDGVTISSGQSVTTLHSSGQAQTFSYPGNWGPGPHTVTVTFTNDAWGGTSTTDRNLYVNSISYDDKSYPNYSAALYSNGSVYFSVSSSQGVQLGVNTQVQTNTSTKVYKSASTGATVATTLAKGVNGTIVGGPIQNSTNTFWQVKFSTVTGWVLQSNITVPNLPPPLPTVTLSAVPTTIVVGSTTTLSWNTTNATSCTGTGFTTTGVSGSVNLSPLVTTTYSVSCTGAGGTASASATVTVNPVSTPPPPPPPTVALSANPTSIMLGSTTLLTWSSTNATSCTGNGFTVLGISGSATVAPSTTTTYGVTCTGTSGSASASALVAVNTPVNTNPPSVSVLASPSSITVGQTSTITWTSANATSCTGTNLGTSGSIAGSMSVSPITTTTYSVACSGAGGSATQSATVTVGSSTTTTPPPGATFDDEFDTLSLHRTWTTGDKWQLIAPDSPDGRGGPNWGEGGDMWWVNPYNPNTPVSGVYAASNGVLQLGLLTTPAAYQTYIDTQAGTHEPNVGAILNTSQTNYQNRGYWNFGMSCDKVPGFSCEISMENVQITGHWPPQINLGISTDGSGNQTVQAAMHDGSGTHLFSQPINGTVEHDFGVDWESDFITFYVDNVKIFQVANSGGVYQTDKIFTFLYTAGNYSTGTGVNPPATSLPAYAHVDYFRVYTQKPSTTTPPPVAPTATLSANPTSITAGQSATLTWTSTNATSCTGNGFTTTGVSGSITVTPTASATYGLTCTGAGGSVSASASVTVTPVSTGINRPPLVANAPVGTWTTGDINGQHYYVLLPASYNPIYQYPVLMFLHWNQQSYDYYHTGIDTGAADVYPDIQSFFNNTAFRSGYPAIVVAPLCNQGDDSGSNINWGGFNTTRQVCETNNVALIHQIKTQYSTDPTRFYLTGNSLGGIGTWAYAPRYNTINGTVEKIFTAFMPFDGNPYEWNGQESVIANQLRSVPIYSTHAGQDQVVPPLWDEMLYKNLGGTTPGTGTKAPLGNMYFYEPDGGHGSWGNALPLPNGKPRWDWMFSQISTNVPIQPTPNPSVILSLSPATIIPGQSSTLSWSSTNATSCTGTGFTASGTSGSNVVTVTATTTYSIVCVGTNGTAQQSVILPVILNKGTIAAPTAALSANPTSITAGQTSTLTWSSTNATSCTGSGFTASGTSGSVSVSPTANTTYSVSCTGTGGTANASASVAVTSGTTGAPTATLTANPISITAGQSSTLSWSSTNATSCTGTGFTVSGISGSASVSPTATTTYSLSCSGSGGSVSKSATIAVSAKSATTQIVLTTTSGGSITDSTGAIWTLTTTGNVMKNGVAVPGGGGTSEVTYVNSTHIIYGQDAASLGWYSWDGANWNGPVAVSPIGQQ